MTFKTLRSFILAISIGTVLIRIQKVEQQTIKSQSVEQSSKDIRLTIEQEKTSLSLIQRSPSFGFSNIIANATFIQFLQYFGDSESRKKSGYEISDSFFKAMLHHDPSYRGFYLFLSGSNTLYAGNPEETVAVMEMNLLRLQPNQPVDGYYIWRYKAVDELLFLGDSEAAQKSFAIAADWAQKSKDPSSRIISELSQKTSNFLADNPNSQAAQIDAWGSLLTTAMDKKTRDRAVERIQSLGGDVIFSEDGGISIQYERVETSAETTRSPDT